MWSQFLLSFIKCEFVLNVQGDVSGFSIKKKDTNYKLGHKHIEA